MTDLQTPMSIRLRCFANRASATVFLAFCAAFISAAPAAPLTTTPANYSMKIPTKTPEYSVIELRRYTTTKGDAKRFATYFDNYFPKAFQQLGAVVYGQFVERDRADGFLWLRGYRDLSARAVINSAFYYGPVWSEHKSQVNAILPDSDNVLQLTPLDEMTAMRMVDPVDEAATPRGIAVIHLLPVRAIDEAMKFKVRELVGNYVSSTVQQQGLLVSLDAPNSFPQLPVRTDGPWIVWVGTVRDEAALTHLRELAKSTEANLRTANDLRTDAEFVVLDPTPLSRMRWLDSASH